MLHAAPGEEILKTIRFDSLILNGLLKTRSVCFKSSLARNELIASAFG